MSFVNGPEALVVETTRAALAALFDRKPGADLPKDQVAGTCPCARGSTVQLARDSGQIIAEQTLTSDTFTFPNVTPGRYILVATDRITGVRLIARDVRPGHSIDLKP